jgi:hypothetical protein
MKVGRGGRGGSAQELKYVSRYCRILAVYRFVYKDIVRVV